MEFRILGPLEVLSDGQSLDLGAAKQRALLAVLLLDANNVVSKDRLIDALWEDDPPETAPKALQVYVSGLRKLLGKDRLETRPPGYVLLVRGGELDLERFRELRESGRTAEALALWRGPPLSDVAHSRFAQPEIARLEDLRLSCIEERVDQDLSAGPNAELTGELEALVADHPLRERLRGQLMLALYRSGRQAEALEAYQTARRSLVDELGIEPGRELRELHQRILNQDPALDLGPVQEASVESGHEGGFVGRESELAALTAGLRDAFAGRGRLFLLQGEPGIGKSRLAEELMARAKAGGACVLAGRCWEAGGAPAYWPWTQSLRTYIGTVEPGVVDRQLGARAADVAQIVPELRELLVGTRVPKPESFEPETDRFRLFDATASFLRSVAAEQPLVLVLDDLHAADEPSLLLLRYVASVMADCRLLIIGTFRDLDPTIDDPLESSVAELGRESVTRRIHLSGLSEGEVAQLAELTAQASPPKQLVQELFTETEGNPLFVSEIVRLLAAEGRLAADGSTTILVPQSVRQTIDRRLRRLPDECRRVLSLASVFGREFGLVDLKHVAGYADIDPLLTVLDEAIAARAVEEAPGGVGRLRFGHALTRDTLYEEIPATRRARLHRQAGEVLEALHAGDLEPHLAELAHHFSQAVPAAPPEKAIEYARRAGDRALGGFAYEEAVRLYGLALGIFEVAPSEDAAGRCQLLLLLGEAQIRAGDASHAKETFFEAAGIARRLGLAHELGLAAAGYGGRIVWSRAGHDHRLVPLLEEALAVLGDDDAALRAMLLVRLACALRDDRSRERRDALSREAVELARRAGDAAVLGYVLDGRSHAIVAPDTVVECLTLGGELREVAARSGDRERVIAGHVLRVHAQLLVGRFDEAELELAEATRIAEELAQPAQLWLVRANEAMLALAAGKLSQGESLIARAFSIGEGAQPDAAIPHYRVQRYTLCSLRGSLDDVEHEVRELVVDFPARPVFRCVLAHLLAASGHAEAGSILTEFAADGFECLPFDQEWLYAMSLLAETASLVGDTRSASSIYDLLAPWAGLNAVDVAEGFRGSVSRYLALVATMLERWEVATMHFDTALAMNERMGARPWLAFTREDFALMLLARGDVGDAGRARGLLDQALEAYRHLGMEAHAARVSAFVRETPASPR